MHWRNRIYRSHWSHGIHGSNWIHRMHGCYWSNRLHWSHCGTGATEQLARREPQENDARELQATLELLSDGLYWSY